MAPQVPPATFQTLTGVVAIAQTRTVNGLTLTLRSLESYQDGFLVQYHLALDPDHPRQRQRDQAEAARLERWKEAERQGRLEDELLTAEAFYSPSVSFTARDELNNDYQSSPASSGTSRNGWEGENIFWPQLDPRSKRLMLGASLGWERFGSLRRPRRVEETEDGSWNFEVDLTIGRAITVLGDDG
jgi:hypothetical protein